MKLASFTSFQVTAREKMDLNYDFRIRICYTKLKNPVMIDRYIFPNYVDAVIYQ